MTKIPVTLITGSLGAGKTTLIMNMVKQFPAGYSSVWLKNEYGDVNVDGELAKAYGIKSKEVLNGCLCCVLLGRLTDAVSQIISDSSPDRIIIETAGTAYPYPILHQLNAMEQTQVDGVVAVVDAVNFEFFQDKTALAREQAKYIDLIVVNKVGMVEDVQLEKVLDEVYDLFSQVPKLQTVDGSVNLQLLIGLDHKALPQMQVTGEPVAGHHDEVETVVVRWNTAEMVDLAKLTANLSSLPLDQVYRVKGVVQTARGSFLVNWVRGSFQAVPLESRQPSFLVLFGRDVSPMQDRLRTIVQGT